MFSSIFLAVMAVATVQAQSCPAPSSTSTTGTLGLGETCTSSSECANGASCYSTNSGLILRCGNFQASCTTNSQCAYNTCNNGLCNGFLPEESYLATIASTTSAPAATGTAGMVYLPLGASCNPASTPCTNGAQCWASNAGLMMRCGNFNAVCSTDSQCAYNTCNTDSGLCSGFLPEESYLAPIASSTTSAPAATGTAAMVYLPLGANCSPESTPCANGAECWASNAMLMMRCGNFNAGCTSDSQCAYNLCNTDSGLCTGFKPTSSMSTVVATSTPAARS